MLAVTTRARAWLVLSAYLCPDEPFSRLFYRKHRNREVRVVDCDERHAAVRRVRAKKCEHLLARTRALDRVHPRIVRPE